MKQKQKKKIIPFFFLLQVRYSEISINWSDFLYRKYIMIYSSILRPTFKEYLKKKRHKHCNRSNFEVLSL